MQALWLENQELRLRADIAIPEPSEGEALVKVTRAGICNTDLEMVRGFYPFSGIPGHEFVGKVELGPPALRDKRVVGEINIVCGTCNACINGRRTHCTSRAALGIKGKNGAFAQYLTLPVENLHALPEAVSDEAATFVEPLAAALEIQEQVGIRPDDNICVVGPGKLGTLIVLTLVLTGASVTVVVRRLENLQRLEKLGVEIKTANQLGQGHFDIAVECTGNAEGFDIARSALRPRGTLVMKSTYAGSLTIDGSSLVVDEITLVGSRCGPFPAAIEMLAKDSIDVRPLIEKQYALGDALAAFEHARKRGSLKIILQPE